MTKFVYLLILLPMLTLGNSHAQNGDQAELAATEGSLNPDSEIIGFRRPDLESILSWVRISDAEIDAYSSISKKDFRFIGYYHPIFNLPIVPGDNGCRFKGIYGVETRVVNGPFPEDRGKEHEEIITIFDEYVEQYNSLIKTHLIESKGLKCDS